MLALPHGAEEMPWMPFEPPVSISGCLGKKGLRLSFTQMGPIPGPPPP